MISEHLLEILWCPSCRSGTLTRQNECLVCETCKTQFPIYHDVPDLIPHDRLATDTWSAWKGHLNGFSQRLNGMEKKIPATQQKRWHKKYEAFIAFLDAPEGRLLDVGCGPGSIRRGLNPEQTCYMGVDPIPDKNTVEFPFARAVAEHLPFRNGTFSSLVIRSALDHLCDPSAFFRESARVLSPDGVMFVEQAIHDNRNPVEIMKTAAHRAKDALDDLKAGALRKDSAPKHMSEFSREALLNMPVEFFTVEETRTFSPGLLAATQLFMKLRKR